MTRDRPTYEEFIKEVVRRVREQTTSKDMEVCVDDLEEYYKTLDYEEAVGMAITNSALWNGDWL